MARIRTIKPEFPHSESMGRISRDARLLFIESWTLADDSGRIRGNSRMLASLLFPYDDDAPGLIDRWIEELVRENCWVCYTVDGNHYVQIINWEKHQKIDKPSGSKLPGFDESSRILANPLEHSSEDRDREGTRKGKDHITATPLKNGNGGNALRNEVTLTNTNTSTNTNTRDNPQTPKGGRPNKDWEIFRSLYPKRSGSLEWAKGEQKFAALVKAGTDPNTIIEGCRRYREWCDATSKTGTEMVKQVPTFLNGKCWLESFDIPADTRLVSPRRTAEEKRDWLLQGLEGK